MTTSRVSLTLLVLLLLGSPGLRPAIAQVLNAGEVSAYGSQTATYAAGCGAYTINGYLKSNGSELVPTTPEKAEAKYTVTGDQASINGDMTSQGDMVTRGSGVPGSFVQTQTLNLSIEGKFQNCPEEPLSRKYTGTQTLEGTTVPGMGAGELKGYGQQSLSMAAACQTTTVKPMNQESNQGSPSGNSNGSGRLTFTLESSSYSMVDRTGPGVAGTYTQTHSVDVGPQMTGSLPPGVTGTTNVTTSQWSKVSTGN
jgi:uncharacterized Zn-binding protein involved in type VI secretion